MIWGFGLDGLFMCILFVLWLHQGIDFMTSSIYNRYLILYGQSMDGGSIIFELDLKESLVFGILDPGNFWGSRDDE